MRGFLGGAARQADEEPSWPSGPGLAVVLVGVALAAAWAG